MAVLYVLPWRNSDTTHDNQNVLPSSADSVSSINPTLNLELTGQLALWVSLCCV